MKPVCIEWPFNLVFIQATMKSGLVGCRRLNATRSHIHIMLISKFRAHSEHVSISMLNTRLSLCAHVIARDGMYAGFAGAKTGH